MAEENDHSLKMQIEADFGISATGADDFATKMEEINEAVDKLSNNIASIRKSGKDLKTGVQEAVEDIYSEIKTGVFEIDGDKITTALEKRIADAISDRGIHIKDLTEGKEALKVDLDKNARDVLKDKLSTELGKLAEKMNITGVNKGKLSIAINNDAIQNIQARFNTVLQKALEDNVTFVNQDKGLISLEIDEKNMNTLLGKVKDRFFQILNNPQFVKVDDKELNPIVVSSSVLEAALKKIRDSIGTIDEQFTPDMFKQISDIPNVKEKIKSFQAHTVALFTELQQTIDAIDHLNPEVKNYDKLKNEAVKMRERILTAGSQAIKEATAIFDAELKKLDTNSDLSKRIIADLDGIQSHINAYVMRLANDAYETMVKELNIARDPNNANMYGPSIQKLQDAVLEASKEALKNLEPGKLKIDVDSVKQIFDGWATETSQQLMANAFSSLTDLQTDLLASNKKVMNAYVKSLKKLTSFEFTPVKDGDNTIEVAIDAKKVKKDIQGKLREIAEQMVSNVAFTKGAENSLDAGLTLNKKQVDSIQSTVASILEGQLKQLGGQLNEQVGKGFNSSLLEKLDKQMLDEAKHLVSTMVDQANAISRAITDGMDSTGFKALSSDEQQKIQERFRVAGSKMVTDFSSMMDNALGSLVLTSAMTEEVKSKIQEKFNVLAKNANITFDDANTPILLNGLVTDVQRELQTAVKLNIEAWKPDIAAFDPNINFKQVFDNINNAINTQLKKASDDIVKMVNEQAKPLDQKAKKNLIDSEVRGKGDMSVYTPEKLAGEDLKRLKRQGFEYLEKGVKGHEYKLKDANKLSDDFAFLMVELDKKFADQARKQIEKVRQQNMDVSKQKIVTILAPIRDGVTTYLTLYAHAVGEAIKEIKPSYSGKQNAKQLEAALSAADDGIKNYISTMVDSMRNVSPTANINAKSLHADVRKLFTQAFDVSAKEWEQAFGQMDESYLGDIMRFNIQAIMDKFHGAVMRNTRDAIKTYGEELNAVNVKPNTTAVNIFATAFTKLQEAFARRIEGWVDSEVRALASTVGQFNLRRSIGATGEDTTSATTQGQPLNRTRPVNYGNGLPFPDFEDGGRKSIGFYEMPGQSEWFDGIKEKFDNDWDAINRWVNQRLLDGLNAKNSVKGKIPQDLQDHLFDYIDNHYTPAVKAIGSEPFDLGDAGARKTLRDEMVRIAQDLRLATSWIRGERVDNQVMSKNEARDIQRQGLNYQLDRFSENGYVPNDRIETVRLMVESAVDPNDFKRIRQELTQLRDKQKEIKKEQETERKQGNLLTQNEALKTNLALQAESLQTILKTVPALQRYNVEQLRINNSTNSWSARLKDADGNVRSLQGTVDRATGSLYQHSEAISTVLSQTARLASARGPQYGKGYEFNRNYYPTDMGGAQGKEYNPNGDFSSSVYNTMRYMTAGAIMGYPSMMLWNAWESNKEFEYQMERARQNFVIKGDLDPSTRMVDVAEKRVAAANPDLDLASDEAKEAIEKERQSLLSLSGEKGNVSNRIIQDMALEYRIDMEKAAQAFHISSRLLDDPNDAFAMTEAVVKANSIEEMDIEKGTKGMEAVAAQWGLKGTDYDKVINMMIMAANYTPATVEDLLQTQQRSGSIFRQALPDMSKKDALSTSVALSAMFNQSTARSGAEGGTFFKTILQSPFTKKGSKALKEYSIQEGFQDLNPYNEDGSQKNFVDVFSSIMEHSLKMSPEQKRTLWASIFPQWHQGSAGAIETFMNDMVKELEGNMQQVKSKSGSQADLDGDGEISVKEAFQDYFSKISEDNPAAIQEMRDGNAGTWIQQMQYLTTMFQSTMSGVFDDLQDEFAGVSNYLVAYMRAVRDNTETVTAAVTLASKIAVGLGTRYMVGQVADKVKESSRQRKENKFENAGNALLEERRSHNLNQIITDDLLRAKAGERGVIQNRKESVTNRMAEYGARKTQLTNRREEAKNRRQALVTGLQNGEDNVAEIVKTTNEIKKLDVVIAKLEVRSTSLDAKLNNLNEEEKKVEQATENLTKEFNESGQQMRNVNNRLDALADAMTDVGLDGQKLRGQVEQLNKEFREGNTTVSSYQTELNELARDNGMTEKSLEKLKEQVDKVNQGFRDGKLSAKQYASAIQELERAHKLESTGVSAGGATSAGKVGQSGMGLMEMIVAGSLLTGGLSMGRGVFDRFKDFKETKNIRTLFGRGAAMKGHNGETLYEQNPDGTNSNRKLREGDVLQAERNLYQDKTSDGNKWYQKGVFGKIGGVAEKASNMRGLGTALRLSKAFGWTMVASEGFLKTADLVTSAVAQEYENLDIQAQKLEDLGNSVKSFKYGGLGQKFASGLSLLGDLTFGSINNLLGGNEASFGQVWKAWTTGSTSKEDLDKKLKEQLDVAGVREKADEAKVKYDKENNTEPEPSEGTLDGETPEEKAAREVEEAAMELTTALSELNATMNRQLSMNEADYTIDKTHMLLAGVREDSSAMRDLMKELLQKNGIALESTLADLRDKMGGIADKDSTTYKDMEVQEKQLQSQIAENNYKLRQNDLSEYDEIMSNLSESLDATEDEYGMQESKAKIAGAADDSPVFKKIQAARVTDSNAKIEQAQTDLNNLVAKLGLKETDADYMKIQGAIRDLEKQQLDNLVAIKSNLDKSKGSFNLPAGIQVTDYMSHMMSKNSHSNVTSRTGDTVVNVTIDNMSGSTKDVQTVTEALTDAVKKANQQANSNFNRQVWSGMGSSYTSPY
ncbi:phage tail tape measure protein [Solibacillus silvestris]